MKQLLKFANRLVRYSYYKFTQPQYLDFVDQGMGIEARYERNFIEWQPHLNASKNFVLRCCSPGNRICVIGAGRLLDVPHQEISKIYSNIHLVDADSACKRIWNKLPTYQNSQTYGEISDVTSKLYTWTEGLLSYLKEESFLKSSDTNKNLASFIKSLKSLKPRSRWDPPACDMLLSINILSQLGIYWRDRVRVILKKEGLGNKDGNLNSEIEAAISQSIATLETEHLELLSKSKSKSVILLYDDEFYYYSKDQAQWQVEAALESEANFNLPGYKLVDSGCWLWHLVPQGTENKEYGEIHRVQARHYLLSDHR